MMRRLPLVCICILAVILPMRVYGGGGLGNPFGPIQGPSGGGSGVNAYVYVAYASDESGTGFTTTFSAALDYVAIKTTTSPIVSPQASDFSGLWKNYKGATGATGAAGASAYVYIAYASDASGTGFTTTYNPALGYIGILATTTEIASPQASDFAGLWHAYSGSGEGSITWKGAWVSGVYTAMDAVEHSGSAWIANASITNEEPGVDPEWDLWVSKGDAGTSISASSDLATALSDETGTGAVVFGTSPTIATPILTTQEIDGHVSGDLTSAQVSNSIVYNTGMGAADVALGLPTAAAGNSALFTVGTAQSNKWGVRAGPNDKIYLLADDGTISAGSDNGYARMTAAQVGQCFACWTFKTDAYDWMCKSISIGTSTFAAN